MTRGFLSFGPSNNAGMPVFLSGGTSTLLRIRLPALTAKKVARNIVLDNAFLAHAQVSLVARHVSRPCRICE